MSMPEALQAVKHEIEKSLGTTAGYDICNTDGEIFDR